MPFVPGQPRPAGAGRKRGRPKGSLNIKSRMARDLMEAENVDPLQALMKMYKRKGLSNDFRAKLLIAMLPHCYPKLSVQEVDMRSLQLQATARLDEVLHSLSAEEARALDAVAFRFAALPAPDEAAPEGLLPAPSAAAGPVVEVSPEPDED
jgi:hypothetical protein